MIEISKRLGLNPLTNPVQFLVLQGSKETLYVTKTATDQIAANRKLNRRTVRGPEVTTIEGVPLLICQVEVTTADGRSEMSTATLPLNKTTLVNDMMKVECLPLDSEILTRRGFKRYDAVKIGEEVLAYSTESDRCEWVPLENVSVYEDAPVSTFATARGGFSFRCTPDHKWAVRKPAYSPRSEAPRGSYANRQPDTTLVEACHVKTHHRVIIAAPAESGDHPLTPDLAAVLGWIMCDGTIRRTGNHVALSIYQSKPDRVAEIRELLARAGLHPHESVGQPTVRTFPGGGTSVCLAQHKFSLRVEESKALLCAAGIEGPGDLPRLVTRLSQPARRAMLDAMMAADGTASGVFGKKRKPGVMDAWQILCALEGIALGKMGTSSVGDVPVQQMLSYNYVAGNNLTLTDAGHEAVWCPTTKHGTWVTRQNGRISITGNTKAKRRATLSAIGLGLLAEDEIETIPGAERVAPPSQAPAANLPALHTLGVEVKPSRKSEPPRPSAFDVFADALGKATSLTDVVGLWHQYAQTLHGAGSENAADGLVSAWLEDHGHALTHTEQQTMLARGYTPDALYAIDGIAELKTAADVVTWRIRNDALLAQIGEPSSNTVKMVAARRWARLAGVTTTKPGVAFGEAVKRAMNPPPDHDPPTGTDGPARPAANDTSATSTPVAHGAAPATTSQALDAVDAPGTRSDGGDDLSTRRARRAHLRTKHHERAVLASFGAHCGLPGYFDDCIARMTEIEAPDGTRLSALTARAKLLAAREQATTKHAQGAMENAA